MLSLGDGNMTDIRARWRLGLGAATLAGLLLVAWTACTGVRAAASTAPQGTVYEMRTYTTHDGRLPALEARFRDHTMRLFEKHGMRNVGYWTPVDRPNTLIYIIAHENGDLVTGNWKAFASDPEWQMVAAESQKDGPILVDGGIVSVFMRPTDFSPLK